MEYNKLLTSYTKPCTQQLSCELNNLPKYKTILRNFKTNEQVREYFFTEHNEEALKNKHEHHLVIPYKITEINQDKIYTTLAIHSENRFTQNNQNKIFSLKNTPNAKLEDIIITHVLDQVDYISQEEFKKYKTSFVL